jgi:hypothetical protein
MNLVSLRDYVRDLTGVYSADLISDSLLTRWVNEAYSEVERTRIWPWADDKVELVTNTDVPVFASEFHAVLAYRVASKVLDTQADDTPRSQAYMNEASMLLKQMEEFYFPYVASGNVSNLAGLRATVRDLIGDWSKNISDGMLNLWINQSYDEVERTQKWPWAADKTPLVTNTDQPAFEVQFRSIIAYRAATKALALVGDEGGRTEAYGSEYTSMLTSMVEHYLPALAGGGVDTLAELRRTTRDMLGSYEKGLSDQLIDRFINQAYSDLARQKPWTWLETSAEETLAAYDVLWELPLGTRRVLELYVVNNKDDIEEVILVPHVLDVPANSAELRYDVTSDGNVTVAPPQDHEITLRARYIVRHVELSFDEDVPLFDSQFRIALCYGAASRILTMQGDTSKRNENFEGESMRIVDSMMTEYQLAQDNRPIQLGGEGIQQRRYIPWFKAV